MLYSYVIGPHNFIHQIPTQAAELKKWRSQKFVARTYFWGVLIETNGRVRKTPDGRQKRTITTKIWLNLENGAWGVLYLYKYTKIYSWIIFCATTVKFMYVNPLPDQPVDALWSMSLYKYLGNFLIGHKAVLVTSLWPKIGNVRLTSVMHSKKANGAIFNTLQYKLCR